MSEINWTPLATEELEDILYYISFVDGRYQTGFNLFYEIHDHLERHVKNEVAGQRLQGAPEGWLYTRYKRWLIFYLPTENGIEVMRVIDGVRDLPRHL